MPIMKRSEVPVEYTWDTTVLFTDDAAWAAEYEALGVYAEKVSAFAGRLGESAAELLAWFRLDDEVNIRLSALYSYAHLNSDTDTADSRYQAMKGKAVSLMVGISAASAFARPEIMAIPEETLARFYQEEPELLAYKRSLYLLRRMKEHILSPAEEQLLAAAQEMAEAPDQICSTLRNAELKFPSVTDSEGNAHDLTAASFVPLLESPDRALRQNAFTAYYTRLEEFKNTIAATLNAQFRQLLFFSTSRRYDSTLEAALHATEVPDAVYHGLIEAVHANMDQMYRYVALRKKLLGTDELHMYDVYTPITGSSTRTISFDEARDTVLAALSVLGEDYTAVLREAFSCRWIDRYENEGKRSGAYCSGTARPHPFVLLNHKDDLNSVFTLAHELGHAMHSWHSARFQPVSTSDYVIFVAEVASTVNEVLLMKYLLGRTEDKTERAQLINHFLDSFKGTVYRQTMFAEFELSMDRMAEQGEVLTADVLSARYLELNKLYFGPDMVSDPEIALEWARIPHFFYNYYVFQYATGFSAAVALAERILTMGAPAVADYRKFLSGGSSADPISLLKLAGVDMSTPEPVNAALRFFGELVDELETLV